MKTSIIVLILAISKSSNALAKPSDFSTELTDDTDVSNSSPDTPTSQQDQNVPLKRVHITQNYDASKVNLESIADNIFSYSSEALAKPIDGPSVSSEHAHATQEYDATGGVDQLESIADVIFSSSSASPTGLLGSITEVVIHTLPPTTTFTGRSKTILHIFPLPSALTSSTLSSSSTSSTATTATISYDPQHTSAVPTTEHAGPVSETIALQNTQNGGYHRCWVKDGNGEIAASICEPNSRPASETGSVSTIGVEATSTSAGESGEGRTKTLVSTSTSLVVKTMVTVVRSESQSVGGDGGESSATSESSSSSLSSSSTTESSSSTQVTSSIQSSFSTLSSSMIASTICSGYGCRNGGGNALTESTPENPIESSTASSTEISSSTTSDSTSTRPRIVQIYSARGNNWIDGGGPAVVTVTEISATEAEDSAGRSTKAPGYVSERYSMGGGDWLTGGAPPMSRL